MSGGRVLFSGAGVRMCFVPLSGFKSHDAPWGTCCGWVDPFPAGFRVDFGRICRFSTQAPLKPQNWGQPEPEMDSVPSKRGDQRVVSTWDTLLSTCETPCRAPQKVRACVHVAHPCARTCAPSLGPRKQAARSSGDAAEGLTVAGYAASV